MKLSRRLTACLAVLSISTALHANAQAPSAVDNNPDLIEARRYTLTMDKIEKLAAATDTINKLTASNPALKSKMDAASTGNLSIDQRAKNIDANFPQNATLIHGNGLTTREYIVVMIAFINDVTFVGMKKQGIINDYPPNSVTPQNAAFVESNFDKLQQIGQKLSPAQS
jgi:hypothetical protein